MRQLEALVRLSEAMARVYCDPLIKPSYVREVSGHQQQLLLLLLLRRGCGRLEPLNGWCFASGAACDLASTPTMPPPT